LALKTGRAYQENYESEWGQTGASGTAARAEGLELQTLSFDLRVQRGHNVRKDVEDLIPHGKKDDDDDDRNEDKDQGILDHPLATLVDGWHAGDR
jgi:hypothetical protein